MNAVGKKLGVLMLITTLFLVFGCVGGGSTPTNQTNQTSNHSAEYTISKFSVISIHNQTISAFNATTQANNHTLSPRWTAKPSDPLSVYFFPPVNQSRQGEAILIKKKDVNILFDAGIDGNALVQDLQKLSVGRIQLFIISAPVPECDRGAALVLKHFVVDEVALPPDYSNNVSFSPLLTLINSKKIQTVNFERGGEFEIAGIHLRFLNPLPEGKRFGNPYNDAYVVKVTDRSFTLMLPSVIHAAAKPVFSGTVDLDPHAEVAVLPYFGLISGAPGATQSANLLSYYITKVNPSYVVITGSSYDPANKRTTTLEQLKVLGIGQDHVYEAFDNIVQILYNGRQMSITAYSPTQIH